MFDVNVLGIVRTTRAALPLLREHLESFGEDLPSELTAQLEALAARLAG